MKLAQTMSLCKLVQSHPLVLDEGLASKLKGKMGCGSTFL
jgi:hypothetical protein